MRSLFWILLIGSILLNVVAVWGFFTYVKYGGSPLGDLKRLLTGTTRQTAPRIPFEDDNRALMDGVDNSGKVVFFGASITQRWDFEANLKDYPIVNRGVGGQLVPSLLSRFKRDVLDLAPKAVIIKLCSINIRPQQPLSVLRDGMTMMSDMAHHSGVVPIVATIIPAGKPEARIGDFSVADSLQQFNDWVRDFASERGYPLVDFASAIQTEEGYLPFDCSVDPVHLNQKGYDVLEVVLRSVLDSVLAES